MNLIQYMQENVARVQRDPAATAEDLEEAAAALAAADGLMRAAYDAWPCVGNMMSTHAEDYGNALYHALMFAGQRFRSGA